MPKRIKYNPADRIADLAVVRMQDRIKEIYAEAERDITRKMNEFTQKFEKRDAQYRADVAAGKIAQADYDAWRRGQVFQSEQWKAAKKEMTAQIRRANQTAAGIVNGERRAVFQKNANYAAYQIERRTKGAVNFSLYDSATVTRLLKEDKKLLPEYKINEVKDYKWNNSKVNNAVTQSIIQGESFEDLTKRLTHSLEAGNRSTMMTFARTAMTGAQNAGRVEAMHDAEDMGIRVQKRWIATLDSRTRDTHAELDGQVVDVDEPFEVDGMEIMYPGDPNADPSLVYNCRCTLGWEYPGVATGIGKRADNETGEDVEGMTYKQWEQSKNRDQEEQPENSNEIISGKYTAPYSTIGITAPSRPNRDEFDNDDEYSDAFQRYIEKKEKYNEKMDKLVEIGCNVERFKTTNDVKEWCERNKVGIKSDVIDSLDIRAFNETSRVLDEMFKRFPEVKNYEVEDIDGTTFRFSFKIGLDNSGLLSANGGFNFNTGYFANYSNGLRSALEQQTEGYLVRADGSFGSLVRHEYGHNVQNYIENKIATKYHYNVDDWRQNFKSRDEYKNAMAEYEEERNRYRTELLSLANLPGSSEYSNTNEFELFAEGFSEWASGGKTEFGKRFGEFLKRWY